MQIDIPTLLPQRPPFLFLDQLVKVSEKCIEGCITFNRENHPMLGGNLTKFGFVPAMVGVEALAQCGGAGLRYLGSTSGLFGLARIENVIFHEGIPFDSEIILHVNTIKASSKVVKQSGKLMFANSRLVSATWICAKL